MNIVLFKEYLELRGMTITEFANALGMKRSYVCARMKYPDRLSIVILCQCHAC